jgi:ribonuclease Y
MSLETALLAVMLSASAGIAFGYFLRWIISLGKKGSMELDIKQMMLEAKEAASKVIAEAERERDALLARARDDVREREEKVNKIEERLNKKEDHLDKERAALEEEEAALAENEQRVREREHAAETVLREREIALKEVAGMSRDEALRTLRESVERENAEDLARLMSKLERDIKERVERRAREALASSVQRLASSVPHDAVTSTVAIPSEEVKGKVIGKEGRNIKTFERATGVDVIIDETPGQITLSSFDPVRREVARIALTVLIEDGRIQPARIEEEVEKARKEVSRTTREKGEEAAYACGVFNLDPKLIAILGRLHFRSSYGQNVLAHSIEVSHIARMIAEEIGADVAVAKAAGLLHDIGKAMDQDVEGTHVEIGRKLLQKFNVDPAVIKAMEAHHGEYPFETAESFIVQAADAVSGGRPGARRESLDHYLTRLKDLEALAARFPGVERAYALQAGREIRVFVSPHECDDYRAQSIARELARTIERELHYPGEIKVAVIREQRSIEYAR